MRMQLSVQVRLCMRVSEDTPIAIDMVDVGTDAKARNGCNVCTHACRYASTRMDYLYLYALIVCFVMCFTYEYM